MVSPPEVLIPGVWGGPQKLPFQQVPRCCHFGCAGEPHFGNYRVSIILAGRALEMLGLVSMGLRREGTGAEFLAEVLPCGCQESGTNV